MFSCIYFLLCMIKRMTTTYVWGKLRYFTLKKEQPVTVLFLEQGTNDFICVAFSMHGENQLKSYLETIHLNFHPMLFWPSWAVAGTKWKLCPFCTSPAHYTIKIKHLHVFHIVSKRTIILCTTLGACLRIGRISLWICISLSWCSL